MQSIVTDKQRCAGPEAARPGGVALGSPSDIVASLGRATTSPPGATLLAEELPRAITVDQCHVIRL